MTRGKRRARRLVELFGVGFLVLLGLSYRKAGTRTSAAGEEIAPTLASEAGGVKDRVRFRDFEYVETRAEEGLFRLRAAEALGYDEAGDHRFRLKDVVFESQESRPGRVVTIAAPRAEFAQMSRAFRVFDGVRVHGEGTALNGPSFRYEPKDRVFVSEGAVSALRGAVTAVAESGSLETRDGILTLAGRVRMRGRMEDGRAIDLTAPKVRWSREGHLIANDGVVVKTDGAVLRSRTFERSPEGAGDRLRASGSALVVLAGKLRGGMNGDPGSSGPQAGGERRQQTPVVAEGEWVEVSRGAEGVAERLALAREGSRARLDLAPEPRAGRGHAAGEAPEKTGARNVLAERFEARLAAGKLAELLVPGPFRATESASAGGPPGAGLKATEAGFARIVFQKDGQSVESATIDKGVVFTDGTRSTLKAAGCTYQGAEDEAVFSGADGAPVDYRDADGSLLAKTVTYRRRQDVLLAAGDVRAAYKSGGRTGLLGGGTEPFFSESQSLELQRAEQKVILTGNVRAWQGENVLRSASIVLDEKARSLRAEGDVRAFLKRRAPGSSPTKAVAETINVKGDVLTYRDLDRFIRIDGRASVVSGAWVIDSEVTDIRLAPDRSIDFAEARGNVQLEDRGQKRRGEGTKATWRPQTDAVTLEGSPATALDGKGNKLTGALLTFRQGRSRVDVESSTDVGSEAVLRPEGS